MKYPEFEKYDQFTDPENPFCNVYSSKDGHIFFVEPGFYFMLQGFSEKGEERVNEIFEAMDEMIAKYPKLVFCGNYESPFVVKEGFVYKEITDITDPLEIYFEDRSRGSDYGD